MGPGFRALAVSVGLLFSNHAFAELEPLLVVSDGYGSCRTDASPLDSHYNARLAALPPPFRLISSCFGKTGFDLRYSVAKEPLRQARSLAEWLAVVQQEAQGRQVVLFGQSFGGWLAIQTAAALPGHIAALVTSDPISFIACGPLKLATGALGCRMPPPDEQPWFAEIATKVERWTNLYQRDFPLLHSGPIGEATINVRLTFGLRFPKRVAAHTMVGESNESWEATLAGIALAKADVLWP